MLNAQHSMFNAQQNTHGCVKKPARQGPSGEAGRLPRPTGLLSRRNGGAKWPARLSGGSPLSRSKRPRPFLDAAVGHRPLSPRPVPATQPTDLRHDLAGIRTKQHGRRPSPRPAETREFIFCHGSTGPGQGTLYTATEITQHSVIPSEVEGSRRPCGQEIPRQARNDKRNEMLHYV